MGQYIPLGIYAWNPNGNDRSAEADFETKVADFTQAIRAPEYIDAFFDVSSWSTMVASAQWVAWSQGQSPVARSLTPVVGVPLGTWGDHGTKTLQQIAAGQHDDVYRGVAEAYKAAGYTTVDMRVGWEMNGNYMPWSMGDTPDQVAAWKAAFAHVADVFHSVAGMDIKVVWNPGLSNNSQVSVMDSYAGDDKVDIVALDIYSPLYKYDPSVSDTQFYNYPAASPNQPNGTDTVQWGLVQAAAFASAHGKPLGIAETGIRPGDGTALPQAIADTFNAPGAPQAAYVNIWDVSTPEGDWAFTGGHDNTTQAAWAAAFGQAGQGKGASQAAQPDVKADAAPVAAAVQQVAQAVSTTVASISQLTVPDTGPIQFLTAGANRAEAAWGAAHFSGHNGADQYVVHSGDATMVVENFSAAKGDWIEVSSALKGTMQQQQFAGGTVLSFAGDPANTQSLYLKGVASVDQSAIYWS